MKIYRRTFWSTVVASKKKKIHHQKNNVVDFCLSRIVLLFFCDVFCCRVGLGSAQAPEGWVERPLFFLKRVCPHEISF